MTENVVRSGEVAAVSVSYSQWISDWLASRNGRVRGLCAPATQEMVAAFPELARTPGWISSNEGSSEHFWCVAPDGSILDPTASQFTGQLVYEPFKPGDEVRVGRCLNCGSGIYMPVESLEDESYARSICSDECEKAMAEELGAR